MCPVFTRESFFQLSDTFLESPSSWGLDWVWSRQFAPREMAVIDKVGVHHTRPLYSGEQYRRLAGRGIDPMNDFRRTVARHGRFDYVLFNRILHGRIPMKSVIDPDDRRSILRRISDHLHWRMRKRRAA